MTVALASEEASKKRDPVARAFDLLRAMVDSGADSSGVRELADLAGLPPSSAHRLLAVLESTGMVTREAGGTYALGMEFHRLAWRSAALMPLKKAALPVLQDMRERSGETAVLGLYDSSRRQVLFAVTLESPNPLRYVLEQNVWLPVHAGATGQAIVAFLPPAEQERIIAETGLAPLTGRTIRDAQTFREQLQVTRERGYAFTQGERTEGAVGVAAPIFDAHERVVGSAIITLPAFRFAPEQEERFGALVREGAARITQVLGG